MSVLIDMSRVKLYVCKYVPTFYVELIMNIEYLIWEHNTSVIQHLMFYT